MAGSSSLHGTLALHFTFKSCLKRPLFASILTPTAASSKPLRSGSVKGGFRSKRGASVPSGIASATFSDDLRPGLGENPEVVISGEWPDNFSLLSYDDLRAYLETQIINEKMKPTATLATVMSTPVRMARPEQTLEEIDHNFEFVSGLPVIDEQLRCIGVISKKDKSRASNGLKSKVNEIMSSPAITLSGDKTVLNAAALMLKMKIHRVPILDAEQKVIGIVTRTDIFQALEAQKVESV
ncbi:uncharacterized protein LOC122038505 [Zingiber officinale]|uniref:uncharacterized protein LOC122038505 n=1 Tax=Zingiber officinale TaxID=94328 RepID=UPI001C4CEABC|nr:uncharacterized protein LOC122038505 [Zingiber officinale]